MISVELMDKLHLRIPDAGQGDLVWHAKRFYMGGTVIKDENGVESQVSCVEDEERAFRITGKLETGAISIEGLVLSPDKKSIIARLEKIEIDSSGVATVADETLESPNTDPRLAFLKAAFHVGHDVPLETYSFLDKLPMTEQS